MLCHNQIFMAKRVSKFSYLFEIFLETSTYNLLLQFYWLTTTRPYIESFNCLTLPGFQEHFHTDFNTFFRLKLTWKNIV